MSFARTFTVLRHENHRGLPEGENVNERTSFWVRGYSAGRRGKKCEDNPFTHETATQSRRNREWESGRHTAELDILAQQDASAK